MKLRNKKTGKIIEYSIGLNEWSENEQEWYLYGNYDTIEELKEEWEDYKPTEPLIKDPKIRKVVRAWADIVPESEFRYDRFERRLYTISKYISSFSISFPTNLNLIEMKDYTLEELCGEEEE